jgi:outer membrane protein
MRRVILKFLAKPSSMLKFAVCFCAAFFVFSNAQAQQVNIGYLNSQRILSEGAPFKAALAKLKQDFEKRVTDLQDMEARVKATQAKLEKDAPVMSEADRSKAGRDLNDMVKEFQRKQRELQEDYNQRRNEEYEVVLVRVNKVVKQVAEENKFDLVVQEAGTAYFNPRIDITDKVLKALNK